MISAYDAARALVHFKVSHLMDVDHSNRPFIWRFNQNNVLCADYGNFDVVLYPEFTLYVPKPEEEDNNANPGTSV